MIKHFWNKTRFFSLVLLLSFSLLAGCSTDNKNVDDITSNQEKTEQSQTNAFPITLKDDLGNEVTIEKQPEKIVSILPSATEILFALGLDNEIIGVSEHDNYPEAALEKEKIGDMDMNTEKIISLMPDVAFLAKYNYENSAEAIKQLEQLGIKVVIIDTEESFEAAYESIELIGKATGKTEEAKEVVASMKEQMEQIKEKASKVTEKKKVWVEISPQPDLYTAGQHTYIGEMLNLIGAENIAAEEGWYNVNEEEVVKLNPEVIVTTYGYYVENAVEQVLSRDGWQEVTAVKNKAVYDVNSDTMTRPGPRLVDGVEELGKAIYPEIFE